MFGSGVRLLRLRFRSRYVRIGLGGAGIVLTAGLGFGATQGHCEEINSLQVTLSKAQIKEVIDSYNFSRTCGNALAAVALGGLVVSSVVRFKNYIVDVPLSL